MSLLEGRRAVVAGAGDIGSVVAQRLNDHGATVEVWDSSPEALAGVQGEGITVHQLDVTDRAAVARFGSITDLDPDDWQQTIDVNLTGVYLCCRAFVGPMAQAGGGSIINISSIGGVERRARLRQLLRVEVRRNWLRGRANRRQPMHKEPAIPRQLDVEAHLFARVLRGRANRRQPMHKEPAIPRQLDVEAHLFARVLNPVAGRARSAPLASG